MRSTNLAMFRLWAQEYAPVAIPDVMVRLKNEATRQRRDGELENYQRTLHLMEMLSKIVKYGKVMDEWPDEVVIACANALGWEISP